MSNHSDLYNSVHSITPKTTPEVLAPEVRALILRERSASDCTTSETNSLYLHQNIFTVWLNHIGEVEPDDKVSVDALESLPRTLKSKVMHLIVLRNPSLNVKL